MSLRDIPFRCDSRGSDTSVEEKSPERRKDEKFVVHPLEVESDLCMGIRHQYTFAPLFEYNLEYL